MNAADSDLLAGLAALDTGALGGIYDRHARSVYGYALLITRHPRDARRTLERTFVALARAPERASTSGDLRRPLLALARPLAWAERTRRRRRWTRRRASSALDLSSPEDLRAAVDRADEESAEEQALQAVEGLGVRDLQAAGLSPSSPARPRGAWRAPPASVRSLVLMKASDAARPARRYLRWLALWGILAVSLLVAYASEWAAPRLPQVPGAHPSGPTSRYIKREMKARRPLLELLEGLRAETEGK